MDAVMLTGVAIFILAVNMLIIRFANRVDKRVEQNQEIISLLREINNNLKVHPDD